jgi:hypothetical protein
MRDFLTSGIGSVFAVVVVTVGVLLMIAFLAR